MPIKVLIVEDNQNLRQALKSLIALSDDFICVGDYDRAMPVLYFDEFSVPDVILMDIDLPGENGISYTRRIKEKYPFINILMLTVVELEDKIMEAIYAGASGYLIKSAIPENILENIRILYKGGSPLTPSIARIIFQNIQQQQVGKKEKIYLSSRETEVLNGLGHQVTATAVDLALVVDVLPDRHHAAKDLGVFNIAGALPFAIAPAIAPAILAIGHGSYGVLYMVAGFCAVAGALAILKGDFCGIDVERNKDTVAASLLGLFGDADIDHRGAVLRHQP